MIDAIWRIVDRLDRLQRGTGFRIAASVLALVVVATLYGLDRTGRAGFLPEAYGENFASSSLIAAAVALGVIWLNHAITALAIALVTAPASLAFAAAGSSEWARATLGTGSLAILFLLAVQLVRLAFSLPWRPLAVARVVVDEAVRMKTAMVFVVALILLIPALTTWLDPAQPLRYRVQTFISYGTGVSYGLLALMTLFVATATVAFDQRDKQIQQVITKPISKAEYLVGKWIGVMGLNGVLLAIVAGSVFWFTQYLRTLPPHDFYDGIAVSEQVLAARVGVGPTLQDFTEEAQRLAVREIELNPDLNEDAETLLAVGQEIFKRLRAAELSVEPATGAASDAKEFTFEGIRPVSRTIRVTAQPGELFALRDPVKSVIDIRVTNETGSIVYAPGVHYQVDLASDPARIALLPAESQNRTETPISAGQNLTIHYYPANALTLRFKVNAGDNDPTVHFPITIGVKNTPYYEVRETVLGQSQTMLIPAGAVEDDGSLTIFVINGDVTRGIPGAMTISFPPDGMEVMYKVGSFEGNYLRGMLINWLKLGFLAMLGVTTATFASFPVASLLAFSIFLGAEMSPFMAQSLEYYRTEEIGSNQIIYSKAVIKGIAQAAHALLQGYGDIRPTESLVEGRLLSWGLVGRTLGLITLLWTGITFIVGWAVMRSRQLAIYSGHA